MQPTFNKFVTYALTPEEAKVGASLNILQRAVIQNRRAQIALDIIALQVNLRNPQKFLTDKIFLEGQLAFADWQLEVASGLADDENSASQQTQIED